MIDFEAELDRLAADLAVLDVACRAGTRVNLCLKALAAIRALDQVKLHTVLAAAIVRGQAGVDYRLKTVLLINGLSIAEYYLRLAWRLARSGPFHGLTIRPTADARQYPAWVV
jgi:hypothetical protein